MRGGFLKLLLLEALALLAVASAQGAQGAVRRCVITEFGAVGDGNTLNTKSIQAAIDRCAEGGGLVVVPKGIFRTGAIFLKPGVNLLVEKGGVLKGSVDPQDYPQVFTRWEGVEREWISALINGDKLDGVELSGEGVIDGSGDEWTARAPRRAAAPKPAAGTPQAAAADSGASQQAVVPPPATGTKPVPAPGLFRGRPRLICLSNSKNLRIRNLTLKNQASWGLHILYSEDVLIEGLTIRAEHNIPSSDGIDIDSSRRVIVRKVDIDVNDDCISIKAGKDADGLRVNRPSEEILVEDSRFGYGHGGVAMGSETSGGIRNVEVRNCTFEDENWAPIRFKSQPSRGGVVENITYRDLRLNGVRQAFEFNMEWRMVPPIAPPAKVLPVVRNVRIINVSGTAQSAGLIHGLKDSPIDGVKFENCRIRARRGLVIENAVNVDVSGLQVEVEEGEPLIRR